MIFIVERSISKNVMSDINFINIYNCINLYFHKVSHQEFSKMKQSNNEANLREEVLKKNLAAAYDNFVELVAIEGGTKV